MYYEDAIWTSRLVAMLVGSFKCTVLVIKVFTEQARLTRIICHGLVNRWSLSKTPGRVSHFTPRRHHGTERLRILIYRWDNGDLATAAAVLYYIYQNCLYLWSSTIDVIVHTSLVIVCVFYWQFAYKCVKIAAICKKSRLPRFAIFEKPNRTEK